MLQEGNQARHAGLSGMSAQRSRDDDSLDRMHGITWHSACFDRSNSMYKCMHAGMGMDGWTDGWMHACMDGWIV